MILTSKCQAYDKITEELVTFLLREAQNAHMYVMKSDLFGEDMLKDISLDGNLFLICYMMHLLL